MLSFSSTTLSRPALLQFTRMRLTRCIGALVAHQACMPGLATTPGVTGCIAHTSATLSLCALHAKLRCVRLLSKVDVTFAPCTIGSLPTSRKKTQADAASMGLVTADGRPCTLQLPEGLALESDSVDFEDVPCVPTMSIDGDSSALPTQANVSFTGSCSPPLSAVQHISMHRQAWSGLWAAQCYLLARPAQQRQDQQQLGFQPRPCSLLTCLLAAGTRCLAAVCLHNACRDGWWLML